MPDIGQIPGFYTVRGSDLNRDGLFLELHRTGSSKCAAEVFYSDKTGEFSVSLFETALPLAALEEFISTAKVVLPPITRVHDRRPSLKF